MRILIVPGVTSLSGSRTLAIQFRTCSQSFAAATYAILDRAWAPSLFSCRGVNDGSRGRVSPLFSAVRASSKPFWRSPDYIGLWFSILWPVRRLSGHVRVVVVYLFSPFDKIGGMACRKRRSCVPEKARRRLNVRYGTARQTHWQ